MGKITACLSHGGGAGNAAMRAGLTLEARNEISHPYYKAAFINLKEVTYMLNLKFSSMRQDTVSNMCGHADCET